MPKKMNYLSDEREYEERADYIEYEDLENWTVDSDFFRTIRSKILQQGAKLIAGPRGTGKTHQMRFVYNACQRDKNLPLAVYVSFSKYYRLEPFLFKTTGAIRIFHAWMLCKIITSCWQLADELGMKLGEDLFPYTKDEVDTFISLAEKGSPAEEYDNIVDSTTFVKVISIIEVMIFKAERKRAILLLDDAALTLTPDYLIEFFDVFRSLKTKCISPKASVYPGTTEYGPRFHLGQDAEYVNAWSLVEDKGYTEFIDSLVEKRLPSIPENVPNEIVQLFRYASFGIPRAFINLVRSYIGADGKTPQQKFNIVIGNQKQLLQSEYMSIAQKLPQYKTIIQIGYELFENIVVDLAKKNKKIMKNKDAIRRGKLIEIGIQADNSKKFDRMMGFLVEAGLMYETHPVSHGEGRVYNRYIPHLLFLLEKKAFITGSGRGFYRKDSTVELLERGNLKHPVRRTFAKLIGPERMSAIRLDLPPCRFCRANRLAEKQKFCHECGRELPEQSVFEKCMEISLDDLPIPAWQKKRIKEATDLRTIQDLMTAQSPASELRKARYIGKKRSESIYIAVSQFVEEFFS